MRGERESERERVTPSDMSSELSTKKRRKRSGWLLMWIHEGKDLGGLVCYTLIKVFIKVGKN